MKATTDDFDFFCLGQKFREIRTISFLSGKNSRPFGVNLFFCLYPKCIQTFRNSRHFVYVHRSSPRVAECRDRWDVSAPERLSAPVKIPLLPSRRGGLVKTLKLFSNTGPIFPFPGNWHTTGLLKRIRKDDSTVRFLQM